VILSIPVNNSYEIRLRVRLLLFGGTCSDRKKMGASAIPVIAFTLLWGAVVFLGVALPLFVPKGPNRG